MTPAARAAEERAAAVEAATRLLERAMRDSHAPVDTLAGALARMATALAQCARALEGERALERDSHPPLCELAAALQGLERDIAVCIESLQFHDRLMQRLERVSGCLSAERGEGAAIENCAIENPCGAGCSEGSIELF
jgi:hypothetical protein